jgi:hypothetical protein
MTNWLPSRAELARERQRRDAAELRACLEVLARPDWPPWPPQADRDYHRWVREHWTAIASDEFDLQLLRAQELHRVERHELCFALLDARDDPEAVRERLAQRGLPVWPLDHGGEWWHWYTRWPPLPLHVLSREERDFLSDMSATVRAMLTWRLDAYEKSRTGPRQRFEQRWRLPQEDLLADLRDRCFTGIRGRYRVTEWDADQGLIGADIDAP